LAKHCEISTVSRRLLPNSRAGGSSTRWPSATARNTPPNARRLLRRSLHSARSEKLALAEFERSQGCFRRATELLGQAEALAEKIGAVNVQRWIAQVRESW
jgi:hypothetical protein